MNVKVRKFPADQVDTLEAKLNEILALPESAGYSLAAACAIQTTNGQVIVLIFEKP